MSVTVPNSSVYYFLGNTTNHILHALPIYEKIGGTFITLSNKATNEVKTKYKVDNVININNSPYRIKSYGWKVKPIHEYDFIDKQLKKTTDFLNDNAKVVVFYDLFDFDESVRLTNPKTLFLTHGNMIKDYMGQNDRVRKLEHYDYMAALGPHLKEKFTEKGIPNSKLVELGVARTDDVIRNRSKVVVSPQLKSLVGDANKQIVAYIPTFWGASSIYLTGLNIIKYFPDDKTLIFRPHPHTPKKILRKYLRLIKSKDNIFYIPDGKYTNISLVDIFDASSIIISDVSSVLLEAILTYKPLIFAYGSGVHRQQDQDYESIKEIKDYSSYIDVNNVKNINDIILKSYADGVDKSIWDSTISNNFYHCNGSSIESIEKFIDSI